MVRLVILVLVLGALVGGGVAVHRYSKRAATRDVLASGRTAYAAHHYTDAARDLNKYLSVDRNNIEVLLMYADAQMQRRPQSKGDLQAAVNALEQILRLQPTHAVAAERLLKFYVAIGANQEVERVARAWVHAPGKDAAAALSARRYLTSALIEQNKLNDAQTEVDQWLAASPDNSTALCFKAQLQQSRGQVEDAQQTLRRAVERHPEDLEAVSQLALLLVTQQQTDPKVAQQNRAEAEDLFAKATDHQSASPRSWLARGQFRLEFLRLVGAETAEANARFNGAVEDLERARGLAAKDDAVLLQIGWLYSEMGLVEKAAATFDQAEQAAPSNTNAYALHAQLALDNPEPARAAAFVDRALAAPLGEQRLDILPQLAELCAASGRVPQARKLLEELKGARTTPETLLYLDAVIDQVEGRWSAARTKLEDAIRLNPRLARAQILLARTFLRANDYQHAIEPLKAYVELSRRSQYWTAAAYAQLELSRVYVQLGRWNEALRAAQDMEHRVPNPGLVTVVGLRALELEAEVARRDAGGTERQRLAAVLERVNRLLASQPALTPVRILQARILAWQGRLDESVAILNELKAAPATREAAVLALMQAYADAGKNDLAAKECAAAIELIKESDRPALRAKLIEYQAAAGDLAATRATLESIAAAGSHAQWAAAKLSLAKALLMQGKVDEARTELLDLVTKDPSNVSARVTLLALEPQPGQRPSPQELVDQIKAVEGEAGLNWRSCQANVWLTQADWATHFEAVQQLIKPSLAADPNWDTGALALGAWYERTGQTAQAQAIYETYLQANPGNVDVVRRLLGVLLPLRRWADMERLLSQFAPDEPVLLEYRLSLLIQRGALGEATRILTAHLTAHPDDFLAHVWLGKVKLAGNDLAEADRQLQQAVQLKPDSNDVLQFQVQYLAQRRDYGQALAVCDRLLAKLPGANILRLRAQVFEVQGDLAKAEADLRAIAAMPGAAEQGYLEVGQLYLRHGQRDRAIAVWQEAVQSLPDAYMLRRALANSLLSDADPQQQQAGLKLLQAMLAKWPQDETLLLLQARQLMRSNPAAAQQAYEDIIRLHPNSAEAYHQLSLLVQQQDPVHGAERALEYVERGLAARPSDFDLLRARSELLLSVSPERALASAREAVTARPNDESAVLTLADALTRATRTDAAVNELRKFLARADAGPGLRARAQLVRLLSEQGDFAGALTVLDAADQLAPANPLLTNARIYWHQRQRQWAQILTLATEWIRQPQQKAVVQFAAETLCGCDDVKYQAAGLDLLQQLLKQDPEDAGTLALLGTMQYMLGRPADARTSWERAISLVTNPDPVLVNNLAWLVCEDLKDPAAALPWSRKAMELSPNDAHVLDTAGVIYFRLGNLDESRQALQKCLGFPRLQEQTRYSVMLHLARTLETVDRDASLKLVGALLNEPRIADSQKRKLTQVFSDANYVEAQALFTRLSSENKPQS